MACGTCHSYRSKIPSAFIRQQLEALEKRMAAKKLAKMNEEARKRRIAQIHIQYTANCGDCGKR